MLPRPRRRDRPAGTRGGAGGVEYGSCRLCLQVLMMGMTLPAAVREQHQYAVAGAFSKLFPAEALQGAKFPWLEDILNNPSLSYFVDALASEPGFE